MPVNDRLHVRLFHYKRRLSSIRYVNAGQWVQRESVSARNSPHVPFSENSGTLRQARVQMNCVTRSTAKRTNSLPERKCLFLNWTTGRLQHTAQHVCIPWRGFIKVDIVSIITSMKGMKQSTLQDHISKSKYVFFLNITSTKSI